MTPRIEIVVDELVVRGLAPHDAHVVSTALEQRLTALAEQSPANIAQRDEAFRKLPPIDAPSGSPAAVGEAIAGAVWGALTGERQ
jgi:hypothetical protein